MKKLNHKILAKRKRKIEKRLERRNWEEQEKPMFKGMNIRYEMDDRHQGIACGGIGVIQLMAKRLGLVKEIDKHLHLLKRHLPYHESDHILNLTYNVLAGGTRLEDIELQRQDEGWMDGCVRGGGDTGSDDGGRFSSAIFRGRRGGVDGGD